MKISFTGFLLAALLVFGCKEKEVAPMCSSVISAPQEFLDYWFMPKGSWWVYKLKGSDPAVYDTVRADFRHEVGISNPSYHKLETCYLYYSLGLGHSNRIYFPGSGDNNSPAVEGFSSSTGGIGNHIYQSWTSAHPSEGYIFSYPIIIGHRSGCCDNWATDTNAVITPTHTFPNSVTFMYGYFTPDSSEYVTRKISYTQKVGITYRKYFNGDEWELINYHINQ